MQRDEERGMWWSEEALADLKIAMGDWDEEEDRTGYCMLQESVTKTYMHGASL